MDSEIYHHISKPSKSHDVKLQKHQKNIVKASTTVVETCNTLIGIKSNEKLSSRTAAELKQKASGSLSMLSKANNYINKMRRDDVLPQLGKDVRQIRFSIPKESKTLFGEDVSKRTASVTKMQRGIRLLVVTQVHLTIIKVKSHHIPLTTVAHQPHTIQKS